MQSEDVHPVSTAYLSAPPQDPPAPPPVTGQASGSLSAPQAAQWLDHVTMRTTRLPVLTSRGMISKWDGQGILRWDLKLAGQWGFRGMLNTHQFIETTLILVQQSTHDYDLYHHRKKNRRTI